MTSNINPGNVDATYPIAGQDNDSQGFRDNFTNIKTSLQYAKDEIEDIQAKAVLKSALSGDTLANDMDGEVLDGAQLQDVRYKKVTGDNSGVVDVSAGNYYTFLLDATLDGTPLSFTNWPASGQFASVRIRVTVDASGVSTPYTLAFGSDVVYGVYELQGAVVQTSGSTIIQTDITFVDAGTYDFEISTHDGGASVSIVDLSRSRERIRYTVEDLAPSAAADIDITASRADTTGAETATLAAGSEGQIKVFAMTVHGGGDMVITVTNPAWGGAGTITLDAVGDGCTLMYTNSKWVCIGNNGCTFA